MYDVIVIGGGHAGIEAANASAKLGVKTALITTKISDIGKTPCNPSIGGPAKGNVVVEIDALGGLMGKISDASMIQIKKLNRSKGPAVQAIRAQIDKELYQATALNYLQNISNLDIIEGFVNEIIVEDKKIKAIRINEQIIDVKSVVLTTGTFLNSSIVYGDTVLKEGPDQTKTSNEISQNLLDMGFKLFRLKTGTPARVKKSSIDFSKSEKAPGDQEEIKFSHFATPDFDYNKQIDCYLTYTNKKTHNIILKNMNLSPMVSGIIEGVGARYCPSIEDKLKRFSDKERHQIFLEPEGFESDSIYVQGFSTSMPHYVQLEMLQSLPGMDQVEVLKYGYAIEYDAIFPEQLKATLETKLIDGLYTAGQINGTSGYEEAAGQGIIAGINAALKIKGKKDFVLTRSNSYIGLMIDDLITKGTQEPYRLLTSRSEYRLFLRNDNADRRLIEKAHAIGLINEVDFNQYLKKKKAITDTLKLANSLTIGSKVITNDIASILKTEPLTHGFLLSELAKRPNIRLKDLKKYINELQNIDDSILDIVEIELKYEGYIKKVEQEIKKYVKNENLSIPINFNYAEVPHLALEAREKLEKINPENIGQASRISGINPSDISVLMMHLNKKE